MPAREAIQRVFGTCTMLVVAHGTHESELAQHQLIS
jgi:hypothetical protein